MVIIDTIDHRDEAAQIVRNLRENVCLPIILPDGTSYVPTVSIGLGLYPDDGCNSSELLTAADAAMYREKFHNRVS